MILRVRQASQTADNVHRWYTPGTGTYTKPDPVSLGILGSVTRPRDLPLDPRMAYYLAMLRTGSPKFEQPYLYGAQNPALYLDPLGLFGPAALATAGGVCVAVDGPLPFGDVVGVPLLAAAGAWAAGEVIKDWWDNREDCDDCDKDPPDICEGILKVDQETCRALWLRRSARGYPPVSG